MHLPGGLLRQRPVRRMLPYVSQITSKIHATPKAYYAFSQSVSLDRLEEQTDELGLGTLTNLVVVYNLIGPRSGSSPHFTCTPREGISAVVFDQRLSLAADRSTVCDPQHSIFLTL